MNAAILVLIVCVVVGLSARRLSPRHYVAVGAVILAYLYYAYHTG